MLVNKCDYDFVWANDPFCRSIPKRQGMCSTSVDFFIVHADELELTIFVLVAFGVNRLILAGLSAGIPLMVPPNTLISANALAVTGGSVWVVLGGGIVTE